MLRSLQCNHTSQVAQCLLSQFIPPIDIGRCKSRWTSSWHTASREEKALYLNRESLGKPGSCGSIENLAIKDEAPNSYHLRKTLREDNPRLQLYPQFSLYHLYYDIGVAYMVDSSSTIDTIEAVRAVRTMRTIRTVRTVRTVCVCRYSSLHIIMGSCFFPDSADFFWRWSDPVLALPRNHSLNVHGIKFLQCAALSLHDEEIDYQSAEKVASRKDVSVSKVNC
jgi:hypothetical protein